MADSTNIIGQFNEEVADAAKDVGGKFVDQLQQAAEAGVQSIIGTQQQNQHAQEKQAEDQKDIAEARRVIKWHKDISDAQKKVREENKQKEMERLSGDNGSGEERKKGKDVFTQIQEKQKALAPTPVSNIENKSKMAA